MLLGMLFGMLLVSELFGMLLAICRLVSELFGMLLVTLLVSKPIGQHGSEFLGKSV